jgi:hypothetical protein
LLGNRHHIAHRLNGTGLVVGQHDRNKRLAFTFRQQLVQRVKVNHAVSIDRDQRNRLASGLGSFQHARVFRWRTR